MSEFLALDWDDQQLIGVDAHVAARSVALRKMVRFDWINEERPAEHPEEAGKRLRAELDRAGIATSAVLVSLPREEAIVRVLELPECTDEELPEIFRFQAAMRSSVPLDRLLLDYLPLPRRPDVPGRQVMMVTLGKSTVDRIHSVLSAAGLHAAKIGLSAIGAAEVVTRHVAATADPAAAMLIVTQTGTRVEITVTSQNKVVLMHAGGLSGHDSPQASVAQIVAEASRAAVALSQTAPGVRLTGGWVLGCPVEMAALAQELKQRFGFDFETLETPFQTPGAHAEFDSQSVPGRLAFACVGLLLAQGQRRVDSIDFLHPRRQEKKPDRRRLRQALAASGILLVVLGVIIGIRIRVSQLEGQIERMNADNRDRQKAVENAAPFRDLAQSLEDWERRDIDWLDQFREIELAMGGSENHYITLFDGNVVVPHGRLAAIKAVGRAKTRDEVEELEQRLHDRGYAVTPKEIIEDPTDRQYPEKMDLGLDVPEAFKKSPWLPKTAAPAGPQTPKPATGATPPGKTPPEKSPSTTPPVVAPATASVPADQPLPEKSDSAKSAEKLPSEKSPAVNQPAVAAPAAQSAPVNPTVESAPPAVAAPVETEAQSKG